MLPIHTILHPTDFSENCDHALQMAAALARDYGAQLVVLHVQSIPVAVYGYGEGVLPPATEARDELWEKLQMINPPGVSVGHRLAEGNAVEEILRTANEVHADLIVMGTHGRRGLTRLLMGSVAELVVRRALCPVLTMRTPVAAGAMQETPAMAGERRTTQEYAI
jgi:nucleotide-binding universal stress UspA family protein